jgi:exopolysaccharide biosynthesis polyprenyl glycosylphosphotransferase
MAQVATDIEHGVIADGPALIAPNGSNHPLVIPSRHAVPRRREDAASRRVHVAAPTVLRCVIVVVDGLSLSLAAALTGTPTRWVVLVGISLALLAGAPLRIRPSVTEEFGALAWRLAIAGAAASLVSPAGDSMVRTALVAVALVPAGRLVPYAVLRWSRLHDHGLEPTVVVGTGPVAQHLAEALTTHHEYGLRPVGFVDSDTPGGSTPLPVLGDLADLGAAIQRTHATRIILAYGGHRDHELADVLRETSALGVEVYYVPRFFELGVIDDSRTAEDVWGVPVVRLGRLAMRRLARTGKRAFDLVIGTTLLVIALPAWALIALAVRLSSPGPVLFRQERVGKDGRPIDVLKFRTMQVNDDSDTTWSVVHDPRCTRVGGFLRRTNLDELPQLLNVLRGEMSLVGPRPERPFFVEQYASEIPQYQLRHRVPVGITGLSQVHGLRGDTSIPERVRFDNHYIDAWSLRREVIILISTLRTFVSRTAR